MKRTVRFAFVLSILVMFATLGNEAWGQRRESNSSNHATETVRSNAGSASHSAANNSRGSASVAARSSSGAGSSAASVSRSANVSRSSASNAGRSNSAAGRSGSAEIRKAPASVSNSASNAAASRSANVARSSASSASSNANVARSSANVAGSNNSAAASRSANVARSSANVARSNNSAAVSRSANVARSSNNHAVVSDNVNAARSEMHISNNGKADIHVNAKDLHAHHAAPAAHHNAVHMNDHMHHRADYAHWHHPYVVDRPMVAPYHHGYHNYGYRIHDIPFGARIVRYRGHRYYTYGGIWYRRYHGDYIIVRPPFGERIAMNMFNFTMATIWVNNVISEIRRAERAAELARAYASVNSGYVVRNANEMNYAADNVNYYYNDGVFYVLDKNEYVVIEAPIGALVSEIPEDYEELVVGNETYYKVDNILFKTSVVDGNVYFEVVSNL